MIQSFQLNSKKIVNKYSILINIAILVLIFLIALIPRIHDLGTGLTTDETLWLTRSPRFFDAVLEQNWVSTYLTSHPGVTTMWVSGLSMHLLRIAGGGFTDVLFAGRLPIALITSGAIVIAYILLVKTFNRKIALLSAILMALEPFLIAHSRFIHVDALLTVFMLLSVLSILAFLNEPHKKHLLVATGFFIGLALLTKLPALLLLLYIPFTILIWHVWRQPPSDENWWFDKSIWQKILSNIAVIACICGFTFFILWPAMWVAPFDIVSKMGVGINHVTTEPHGSGFFMGEISDGDYGALFYPVVILMRSTPLTLVFSVICLGFVIYKAWKREFKVHEAFLVLLALYILLFTMQMSIGQKAFDRYLLPIFPMMDILAAAGIYYSMSVTFDKFQGALQKSKKTIGPFGNVVFFLVLLACIIIQSMLLIPIVPYYHAYFNPVALGGSAHAPEILLVGWGEGNDLAAEYLNSKPDAKNLTVVYQYEGFRQYFVGKSIPISEISKGGGHSPDYLVFYIMAVQRNLNPKIWNQYKNYTPEKIIQINGIDYCWIYNAKIPNISA